MNENDNANSPSSRYGGIAGDNIPTGADLAKLIEQDRARLQLQPNNRFIDQPQTYGSSNVNANKRSGFYVVEGGEITNAMRSSGLLDREYNLTAAGRAAGITEADVREARERDGLPPAAAPASPQAASAPAQPKPSQSAAGLPAAELRSLGDAKPSIERAETLEAAVQMAGAEVAYEYVEELINNPNAPIDPNDHEFAALERTSLARAAELAREMGVPEFLYDHLSDFVRKQPGFGDAVRAAAMNDWSHMRKLYRDFDDALNRGRAVLAQREAAKGAAGKSS